MIEGITFFLFLEILLFTSLKLKDVALVPNRARIKKNILTTFMVGVAGFGILLIIRVLVIKYGLPGKSYFIGGSKAGIERYFFTAVLQEFLSRGVMQTSVKYLLQIRFQKPIAIIVTSLLFAIMHLPYGFPFMVGAFALSVALGILYEYQEDMWGCALLHWLLGYLAMALFF